MRKPIFVRPLSEAEQEELQAGLAAKDAFSVRRCQIILSSAGGKRAPQIAQELHCNDQTVRNALAAFEAKGLEALRPGSCRPHRISVSFEEGQVEQLKELLHHSPRDYDKPTSIWTLALAAEVAYEQHLIQRPVSDETVRQTLRRHGIRWRRAKQWLTSPDPAYGLKKNSVTG
jgi:transposase